MKPSIHAGLMSISALFGARKNSNLKQNSALCTLWVLFSWFGLPLLSEIITPNEITICSRGVLLFSIVRKTYFGLFKFMSVFKTNS